MITKEEKSWIQHLESLANSDSDNETNIDNMASIELPLVQATKKNIGRGFKDIAGMDSLKDKLTEDFINVLRYKEHASKYGIKPPAILFYGPSGCGKTFFAEKVAEEVGVNFMKVVPDDLACTWIHGTQQKIAEIFLEAEKKAPILLFFDEFDAMVPRRNLDVGNQHFNGEVNEFLCKMDNASDKGVYVLAATNHPEMIDEAILRTGRIDEMIYIDIPDKMARESLFRMFLSKLPKEENIDYFRLANITNGFSCSDIKYIVNKAATKMFNSSIRNLNESYMKISESLLVDVISTLSPSVHPTDLRQFERIRSRFSPKDCFSMHATIGFVQ